MNVGRSRGEVARHNIQLQEKLAVALDRIDALEDAIERHQDLVSEPSETDLALYAILEERWDVYGGERLEF